MLMTDKSIQRRRLALYVALIIFCMVKPTSAQTQRPDTLPAKANHSDGYTAIEINRGRETDNRLPGPAPVIPSNKTAVTAIRFLSWQNYTRVMLELSQEAKYEVRRLKEDPAKGVPARLYVDIQGARVAMTSKDTIPVDDGLLSQVRIGQFSEDIVRVVLDMTNLGAHNAFVLPGPYRLVIDIYSQKALAPTAPIVAPAIRADLAKSKVLDRSGKPVAPAPPVQGLRKIVLDPGHGGKDPGAIGNGGIAEKDLVLSIARKLAAKLKKEMNVQVVLTRNDDRFVPLEDRTALANAEDADLFISLHMNASPNSEARGIETYYLDNTSDEAAIRLAARENSTARKNISDLQFILSDMTQNLKLEDSISLAHRLQGAAVGGMGKVLGEVKDLGVKKALFYVLVGARMPSVLVEMFFISNREEGRAMSQGLYQDAMVDALFDGIQKYDQAPTMARTL
ncbi:MAG: N-acetylmuramoyl-L-alanine amidase [Candidatus Binatota bacterium]|nr:N-acetylmuramoyl-L-alanine amidase [Candidatus Binatota bacterium]